MSLAADDDFLNTIAHQARVAYATQQLHACRNALQQWQAVCPGDSTHVQQELAHYSQQVERWENYLGHLGAGYNVLVGSEMPLL